MKKLFLGIALLLLIGVTGWVGATWVVSNSAEDVLNNAIVETNDTLERDFPFAKLTYKSFDKGLVKSAASTELRLDPELFDQEVTFLLQHTIHNGPVMMTDKGIKTGTAYITTILDQQSLAPKVKAVIDSLFSGREPFKTGMLTGVGDEIVVDMDLAPLFFDPKKFPELTKKSQEQTDPSIKEPPTLTVDGMTANFSTDMVGTKAAGTFQIGEISVDEADGSKITIAASSGTMDMQELYRGSMLAGSLNYVIPNIVAVFDGNPVTLKDVTFSSSTTDKGADLEGDFVAEIASIKLEQATASGYLFPESKFRMNISVQGMDKASVKKLIDAGNNIDQQQFIFMGQGADAELDEQTQQKVAEYVNEYFAALANVVKAGLAVNYNFDLSNESGISNLKFDVAYMDSRELYELKTIRDFIEALKADINIKVSKDMIAGTPAGQAIAMPVAMGFATEKDAGYETIAHLEKGELIVNGEVIPLLNMIGAAVNQPVPWEKISAMAVE